jgi:D-alanine-D-alanine ligase
MEEAFKYDPKVIIEEKIVGRELECAVLGNEFPETSVIGEVKTDDWYSFDNKYVDEGGSHIEIPAQIDEATMKNCQNIARKAYQILECEGLSRVDMFLKENGEIIVNEINTIPGFTNISMYPQLWKASGISYENLITTLIELALESHQKRNNLKQ